MRPRTATTAIFQLLGTMISTLQTMQAMHNTNSYIPICQAYRGSYCDNSLWVGTRYGSGFSPDELEVYYEVLA